jgi:hypothetical protein
VAETHNGNPGFKQEKSSLSGLHAAAELVDKILAHSKHQYPVLADAEILQTVNLKR